MLQELKMKSLKGHAASIIIALALAAGLLWGTGFGAFKAIGGPKPLDSLDVSELKGQYVEAEVYLIYDWYAYTERTNTSTNRSTVTEKEYIIPVGDADTDFLNSTFILPVSCLACQQTYITGTARIIHTHPIERYYECGVIYLFYWVCIFC